MTISERKTQRISVRVPPSWVRSCHEMNIDISYVCRSALHYAIKQHSDTPKNTKLRSKQLAASLFFQLKELRAREAEPEFMEKMNNFSYKSAIFKNYYMEKANPAELIVLAEFLDQGVFAEDILQEVYKNE